MGWSILTVRPTSERQFLDQLKFFQPDLQAYVPQYGLMVRRRHARKPFTIYRPAMPGYIFVNMEPDSLPGQLSPLPLPSFRLLKLGERAALLDDDEIADLRKREKAWIESPFHSVLSLGERVLIKDGALIGITGTVVRLSKAAARVRLNAGRRVGYEADVPLAALSAAPLA